MSSALSTHPACGCIDVHHHHGTPEFAQFMADTPSDRAFPPNTWRVEEALADMDEAGVRTAILSQFPPYHLSTAARRKALARSDEHTSELQSLMRTSYAVFCLKKKNNNHT